MVSTLQLLSDREVASRIPLHTIDPAQTGHSYPFFIRRHDPRAPSYQFTYPHRHDFYQILFLTGGRGHHVVDDERLPVQPPMLYLVSPRQVHYWQLDEPLQGYSVTFGREFVLTGAGEVSHLTARMLFDRLINTPIRVAAEHVATLQETLDLMAHEHTAGEVSYESVVSAYLHVLLCKIQRLTRQIDLDERPCPALQLVHAYRRLVGSHFLAERSITFYAGRLGVSPAHLSQTVKTVTGSTAGQILRQELVLEAKRLLTNTDWPIEQVSETLAFSDAAYFGRFFKRETGLSPGAYRLHWHDHARHGHA